MKKVLMFAVVTLLAGAVFADGEYLETMRRREVLMMNAPRYARTQNPTLRAWALGERELTVEEVYQLRADRQAKARQNRAKLAQEALEKQQTIWGQAGRTGYWGGGAMGLPGVEGYRGYYGQRTGLPSYQSTPLPALDGYGAISELTGRPKTVSVKGYYRKDGTYVRPHFRSPPRR